MALEEGLVVLITGCSSGIRRALAKEAASRRFALDRLLVG